jgi:hypothetical protein
MSDLLRSIAWRTPQGVAWWHTALRAIAVLNIALWSLGAAAVARAHMSSPIRADAACYLQLGLSAAYVAGCAYRCFLPVIDIPRIVLIKSPLSSVTIGRSVATVAELCFAAQWALLVYGIAALNGSRIGTILALAIVPLVVLAELYSWYAVLTTWQRAHAFENALWGAAAAIMIAAMLTIGLQRLTVAGFPVIGWCLVGAAYVAFIVFYDVPMYWSRWRADQASGHRYLSVAQGWADVRTRQTVSYRWDDWKSEVPWMSLYFTFGVWSSISLIYTSLAMVDLDQASAAIRAFH